MLQVEVVNSGEFPTGEVIIAGAAVFAAAVAAWTADRRLKTTLAAEKGRHQAELDHDRAMRDLDEIRKTLDEIGAKFASVKATGAELIVLGAEHADDPDVDEVIQPLVTRFAVETAEVRDRYERMVLRLGTDDPLTVCVDLVHTACWKVRSAIDTGSWETDDDLPLRLRRFLAACSYYSGVFGGNARQRFASQFSQEEDFEDFRRSIRQALTDRERSTELAILTEVEQQMDISEESRGEAESQSSK